MATHRFLERKTCHLARNWTVLLSAALEETVLHAQMSAWNRENKSKLFLKTILLFSGYILYPKTEKPIEGKRILLSSVSIQDHRRIRTTPLRQFARIELKCTLQCVYGVGYRNSWPWPGDLGSEQKLLALMQIGSDGWLNGVWINQGY